MFKPFKALQPFHKGRVPFGTTDIQRAIAVLRRFGPDAHVYLPGVGMLNGLQAANYIDSAGTQAGAVDQPVGLVLDAGGGLGVELVTNGDFSAGAIGWTVDPEWSVASGSAVHTGTASNYIRRLNTTYVGKTYLIKADVSGLVYQEGYINTLIPQGIERTAIFVASSTSLILWSPTNGGSIDNISVREVTGIHGTQATTSAKPILRRGAVNLLTWSGDFTNAAWSVARCTAPLSSQTYLDGTLVSHIVEDTTSNSHPVYRSISGLVSGDVRTAGLIVKASVRSQGRVAFSNTAFGSSPYLDFDLGAATVAGFSGATGGISDLGGGWYFVFATVTATALGTGDIYIQPRLAGSAAYLGTGASALYIHRAALFQGTYTAAQIQALGGIPLTTTAPASTALGSYFWQFDGSNDSLSLGGPLLQMADDHCVVAGMSIANTSSNVSDIFTQRGATGVPIVCELNFGATTTKPYATWRDDAGVLLQLDSGTSLPLNSASVASARKTGNSQVIRVNGLQKASSTTVFGAASITTAAIGSDSQAAKGNYFPGSIYPVIAIKGTVTDPDLLLLEKLVGQMSGVTIV